MNRREFRRGPDSRVVETSGKTMEEAVQAALRRLHARRDEIDIEVLDEGRGGFLGIGAKEARIRARLRQSDRQEVIRQLPGNRLLTTRRPWQIDSAPVGGEGPSRHGDRSRGGRGGSRGRSGQRPEGGETPVAPAGERHMGRPEGGSRSEGRMRRRGGRDGGPRSRDDSRSRRDEFPRSAPAPARPLPPREASAPPAPSEPGMEREIAGFATGLLSRMGFPAQVEAQFSDGAYEVRIDAGEADAILIGRRGETLEALQHVLAKMVSRGREELVRVRVDISQYKERRNGQLAERALEIAQKVRETGHEVITEPLSAAERRIIHRTLSETPDVTTKALGDGLVKRVWIGPVGAPIPDLADITPETLVEVGGESAERPRERSERPHERPERPARTEDAQRSRPAERPVQEPAPLEDRVSWLDAQPTESPASEAPEWGRRPKPAKGRRR